MRALALSVVCVVAGVAGCRAAESAPVSNSDALWKLAPDDAVFGAVMTPRGLAMTAHALTDVFTFVSKAPELAPLMAVVTGNGYSLPAVNKPFAELGLSTTEGAALFVTSTGNVVAILPVADRAKFVAAIGGTPGATVDTFGPLACKPTHGTYACSLGTAMLDRVGTGNLGDKLALAQVRGDIEIVKARSGILPLEIAAAVELERGGVTIRGAIGGASKQLLTFLGPPSRPRTDGDHANGFGLLHLTGLIDPSALPRTPVAPGVPVSDLVATLHDPITVTSYANGYDVQLPLTDRGPAAKFLATCDSPDGILATAKLKVVDGACRYESPSFPWPIDWWLDGNVLHVGTKTKRANAGVPMTALGTEIAKGDWAVAAWGRGSLIASNYDLETMLRTRASQADIDGIAKPMIRLGAMLDELGVGLRVDGDTVRFVVGIRTAWANPDAVVARLATIDIDRVMRGKAGPDVKAIVNAAPKSPLASAVALGHTGYVAPLFTLGIVSALIVPAYLDTLKLSRVPQVTRDLDRLGKSLAAYYRAHAAFPKGDAAMTPAGTCCGQPKNQCAVDAKAWSNAAWRALDFKLDAPTLYQYSYHSDGKTAVVEARGDADCDGVFATWKLDAKVNGGSAVLDIRKPAPGVY